jgi:hypothetical protein
MKQLSMLAAALLIAGNAYAHGPAKGTNGGPQVDAGDYHVELVAKDTALSVYINDKDDKPVDAKGFKATGLFVVSGKPQRIELKPETTNKLTGMSAVPMPAHLKGAVQITLPTGKTVQAKFE